MVAVLVGLLQAKEGVPLAFRRLFGGSLEGKSLLVVRDTLRISNGALRRKARSEAVFLFTAVGLRNYPGNFRTCLYAPHAARSSAAHASNDMIHTLSESLFSYISFLSAVPRRKSSLTPSTAQSNQGTEQQHPRPTLFYFLLVLLVCPVFSRLSVATCHPNDHQLTSHTTIPLAPWMTRLMVYLSTLSPGATKGTSTSAAASIAAQPTPNVEIPHYKVMSPRALDRVPLIALQMQFV